ncbi:MAG: PHP domain-containing protein, partial [Verrucomicrobia bacterium]|nr:PHP domain-containing protein [Verrucomicrobiota bacterium]
MRGHDLVLRDAPVHPVADASLKSPAVYPGALSPGMRETSRVRPLPLMDGAGGGRVVSRAQPLKTWVPLAVHSYYSMLDSTMPVEFIASWAASRQLPAIALTDVANLHGAYEFSEACRRVGVKPVLGVNVFHERSPVYLYVMDARGYGNLCRLLSPVPGAAAAPSGEDTGMDPLRHYHLHV